MAGTYRHGVSDEEIAAASQKARAGDNFTRQQRDYWQEQAMRYERERDEAKARIEALEKEALEWEARACAMFPYVPDDTKCGTLAKARDEAKARLERTEALEEAAEKAAGILEVYGATDVAQEIAAAIRALREKE